ncbi:Tripartite motif-containing protein 60 [Galemys pyrenaicus]|uniref:Tripartite motif-containing protein 60 n=1 Tax=Galemys pyrenaicus TaxID=202257 RepID=A0A8J6DPD0_GALPY|nr:Tripartite motif-containing protein 60 [Galemys pyrenaicus]
MALSASLLELQAEASCPVCLDLLRDPVTLNCGHNCCGPCLRRRWEGLGDVLPCPVCQHHCPSRDVRKNTQLSVLTGLLWQLAPARSQASRQEEAALCGQHQLALGLFCEEDLELLCVQCAASPHHQGHLLTPVQQAAARHREKLQSSLRPLAQQLEEAQRGLVVQVCKTLALKDAKTQRRMEVQRAAAQLRHSLQMELEALQVRALRVATRHCRRVLRRRDRLLGHGSALQRLLDVVTRKSLQTDPELLTGLGDVHLQWGALQTPVAPPTPASTAQEEALSLPPRHVGLPDIIDKFQEDLTLDPDTAHPHVRVSADRKSAVFASKGTQPGSTPAPGAFSSRLAVLGSPGFGAGRHFWQVDVWGSGAWSLGVCGPSFLRRAPPAPSPRRGCWQYEGPSLEDAPRARVRAGVFLDCDLGEVSFYNLSTGVHLCTLRGTFTEMMVPYFCVEPSALSVAMTLVKGDAKAP